MFVLPAAVRDGFYEPNLPRSKPFLEVPAPVRSLQDQGWQDKTEGVQNIHEVETHGGTVCGVKEHAGLLFVICIYKEFNI